MEQENPPGSQRLLWITDPHLEKAPNWIMEKVVQRMQEQDYEMALITGDIANAKTLPAVLPVLAEACGQRRLFVVLGNHDFAGADINETISTADDLCHRHDNLIHLTTNPPLRISRHTTLVGHHGLSGDWKRKEQDTKESSEKILHGIFSARRSRTQLLAATHYPPFTTAALFNSQPCKQSKQAVFCNAPLGYMLIRMAKQLRHLSIRVLAGHTHHLAEDTILSNLKCLVGGAGPGQTGVQRILYV